MAPPPPPPSVLEVQAYFAAHRWLFETVELAAHACATAEEARALCEQVRLGERELPVAVPSQPAVVDPPATSGYLGVVSRGDLPPEVAEAVFAPGAGEVVGPVRYAGREWVYRILLPPRPELTEQVYALCEARVASVDRPAADQRLSAGT